MRLFRHFEALPADVRGAAVAIGNFDGVHLGHHAVIGEAGRIARANGVAWAVLTLEPHPRAVFQPTVAPFRLTPEAVKARRIAELGPDALVIVPFDMRFSRLPARSFVEDVIVGGLGARHVVCGHDFAFGHGRKGTPELLLWLGDEFGFGFTCVQEVRDADAEPYSSTRIRELLRQGDVATAARLLGRPFEIEGTVVEGDRRGRQIGFPTANVRLGDYLRPALGVYAVWVATGAEGEQTGDERPDVAATAATHAAGHTAGHTAGATTAAKVAAKVDGCGTQSGWHAGIANIGRRPTFDGEEELLEVHLLDRTDDLYGRRLRVRLAAYVRPERRFDGIDALKRQIAADVVEARRLLGAEAPERTLARAGTR
jgi:riboflavin kinase/FMN adenylyltransferase